MASFGSLKFYKIRDIEPVINHLVKTIRTRLMSAQPVLWLLSGGSFIDIEIAVAKNLAKLHPTNLIVTLVDERYGPDRHAESNWQKLLQRGFEIPGAKLVPILQAKDRQSTSKDFASFMKRELNSKKYKLGCIGVGKDGHVLGVLPHSPAVDSRELVVNYRGADFERITLNLDVLEKLDEIVVYMLGVEKHRLIKQLATQNIGLQQQPAQALKRAKKVLVYNDYIGETA